MSEATGVPEPEQLFGDLAAPILDSFDQGFCVLEVIFDEEGRAYDVRYVYTNSAFDRESGMPNMIGRTARERFPKLDANWFEPYGDVARTGKPSRFERTNAALGKTFDVSAFRIQEPEKQRVAVLFRDVTERKRAQAKLEERERQLEDELRVMLRIHQLVSRLLVVPSLSAALSEVLDASIDLVGNSMGTVQVIDPDSGELKVVAYQGFDASIAALLARVSASSGSPCFDSAKLRERILVEDLEKADRYPEYRKIARDAGYRAVQSTPLLSRSNEFMGILSTYYEAPTALGVRELRILDIYARQASDFIEHVRFRDQLQREAKRKDVFLATLAHELRNPLAPICSGIELMSENLGPDEFETVRSTMDRQAKRLVVLVDDLLDVSRITLGKLSLKKKKISLQDVVRSAVESSTPFLERREQKLALEVPKEPVSLEGDPHRLAQVVSNLLNNASKYSPRAGQIRLALVRNGDESRISVEDQGVGIAPEMQKRVFEAFEQVPGATQTEDSGLGIGLTLSRSLVELHGGKLEVFSEGVGKGSRFTTILPCAPEGVSADSGPAQESVSVPRETGRGQKIVLADDNPAAAMLLKRVLELIGHEVEVAVNGKEAVAKAEQFAPDAIFMDIGMPVMDGIQAAKAIRATPWGKAIKLIALTGWGMDEDRQRSQAAGFDLHLVKPIGIEDAKAALSS